MRKAGAPDLPANQPPRERRSRARRARRVVGRERGASNARVHRRPRALGRPVRPQVRSTLPLRSCAVSGAKQPTPYYHHHCLTRRDTRGTKKPTAHVSVIAANARAARYSPFLIASTQATPPAMTAKSKSSDAAHRDGMEIRVTPPRHAAPRTFGYRRRAGLPAPCHPRPNRTRWTLGSGAFRLPLRCRRRDSNPRHTDYDCPRES